MFGRSNESRTIAVCLASLAILLSSFTKALAISKDDDIDTNRPSFMASPLVVPKGSLQLENGTLYQHFQHGKNYFDTSETEVRLGLNSKTEFQMFVPNYVLLHTNAINTTVLSGMDPLTASVMSSPAMTQSGVSDLNEIGLKRQIGTYFKDLNISAIAGVSVPTGSRLISGTGVQPVIRAPYTKGLTKNWSIGGMQSITVINSGRDVQYQNFFLVSRAFGARTSMFFEYGGYYTHRSAPLNIFHSGVVRKINRNNQIDLQYGFGMNKTAPTAFIGAGYSFRFDHLPILN